MKKVSSFLSFSKLSVRIAVLVVGLLMTSQLHAQVSTYKGQALFIYNFTKYINWQSSAGQTMVIGIMGKSPIMAELANFQGKKVGGRAIEVKQISAVSDASGCHIVYVPSSRSYQIADLNTVAQQRGVLVISEEDQMARGAGISFVIINSKLKFKVNPTTLREAGLQISNDLLAIAVTD